MLRRFLYEEYFQKIIGRRKEIPYTFSFSHTRVITRVARKVDTAKFFSIFRCNFYQVVYIYKTNQNRRRKKNKIRIGPEKNRNTIVT